MTDGKTAMTNAEYIASWDESSAAEVLRRYENGQLLRDVDRDTDVLIACQDRDDLIRDMLRWMPCVRPCYRCERETNEGCEFDYRARRMGVEP